MTARLNPFSLLPLLELRSQRYLIAQMIRRDILTRYRGSALGILWSLVTPILLLLVYTFVFGIVFQARWGPAASDHTQFAIILFTGLLTFAIFAECANRAPTLVQGNPNYVKKIVFPLEVLPVVSLGSALFHAGISLGILLIFNLVINGTLQWTLVYLPLVALPLLLLSLGTGWLLSALGVYLRDIAQAVGLLTTILLFLSPIFYPLSAVPESLQALLRLNPLTMIIAQVRGVVLWGEPPAIPALVGLTSLMALFAWASFAWFLSLIHI